MSSDIEIGTYFKTTRILGLLNLVQTHSYGLYRCYAMPPGRGFL